jgi:hypothetical protein
LALARRGALPTSSSASASPPIVRRCDDDGHRVDDGGEYSVALAAG